MDEMTSRFRAWSPAVAEAGLYLYLLTVFAPGTTALQRIALWIGFLAWLLGCSKPYLSRLFREPLLWLLIALVGWMLIGTAWSLDPALTRKTLLKTFDDYVLVIPLLVHACAQAASRRRLGIALALAGLVAVALNALQYAMELQGLIPARDLYIGHRDWSYPLQLFSPFALLMAVLSAGRARVAWYLLFIVQVFMMVAAGARGGWLGFAAGLGVWLLFAANWRAIVAIAGAVFMVTGVAYLVMPEAAVKARFERGMDPSHRMGGTWGPAIEMANDRPLLGYGFGRPLFHEEFNRRVDANPEWEIRKSAGPHSNYLEIAFAGGYPAMALLVAIYAAVLWNCLRAFRTATLAGERLFALAAMNAFVSVYVVRGFVESVRWAPLALFIGLALALSLFVAASRGGSAPSAEPGAGSG
jgi:O-antigen ligase